MTAQVLVYRGWGDNGLGVYGYILGTDITYEISGVDPDWVGESNGFSQVGTGFVFRGENTSGSNDTMVYSDGTAAGTINILLDENGNALDEAHAFSAFGNETIFLAGTSSVSDVNSSNPALMITDGNGAPQVVLPFAIKDDFYSILGDKIYAVAKNGDLYRIESDLQYTQILDADATGSTLHIDYMFEFNGALFFRSSSINPHDFHRVDPVTGVITALNINPVSGGDTVRFYYGGVGDTQFFFWDHTFANGIELWVSDGTAAGTHIVLDINPGNANSFYSTPSVATVGDKLFFFADDGGVDDEELWVSDGTAAGTFALSGSGLVGGVGALSFGAGFRPVAVGNLVFFTSYRADVGTELFVTDGTVAGTKLVLNINPSGSSTPISLFTDGTLLYFTITSGPDDEAIWVSDGTTAGTHVISDPDSGSGANDPRLLSIIDLEADALPTRTINGTNQSETLDGIGMNEIINGFDGADILNGFGGNDVLRGGSGADQLSAGAGDDLLFVDHLDTLIDGGAGYDRLFAEVGSLALNINLATSNLEYAQGGNWNDVFDATTVGEAVKLWGHGRDDTLTGSAFADYINGGAGNDTLNGLGGNDILDGNVGADIFNGGAGNDIMYIDNDDTTIDGGADYDQIFVRGYSAGVNVNLTIGNLEYANGNSQGDTFHATGATWSVKLFGQGGNDVLIGGNVGDQLYGSIGMDVLYGYNGNDILSGGSGADELWGGIGDDILFVDADDTQINGGADYDRVYVTAGSAGVTINMTTADVEFAYGAAGNDIFNAASSTVAVKLQGRDGADTLTGGNLADLIYGGTGADNITGGTGNDFLSGGGADGAIDTFFFASGWGDDTISDFQNGEDIMNLASLGTIFVSLTITALGANNSVVSFGGNSITLLGMQLADVDAGDFVFV